LLSAPHLDARYSKQGAQLSAAPVDPLAFIVG
jgi:hypothetical protein